MSKQWSSKEDKTLKRLITANASMAECETALPGRTAAAIYKHCRVLEIDRPARGEPGEPIRRKSWRGGDNERMRDMVLQGLDDESIIRAFPGRSRGSVLTKLSEIRNAARILPPSIVSGPLTIANIARLTIHPGIPCAPKINAEGGEITVDIHPLGEA